MTVQAIQPGDAGPAVPAVRFDDTRRPETSTRVQLSSFEGPLGLLLALIEARQLDVLTVPLGALAEAYLEALAGLEGDRLGSISAFVAVAGQLILIKSRAMLPRAVPSVAGELPDEGPDPEAELRARLLLYRAHRDAGERLAAEGARRIGLFHREPSAALASGLAGARPDGEPPLDPALLGVALGRIARLAPPPELPPEVVPRIVTIEERAAALLEALRGAGVLVLQELLRGVRDRVVLAVTFLALLELVKRREILVEQAEPWGPIIARTRGADGADTSTEQGPT